MSLTGLWTVLVAVLLCVSTPAVLLSCWHRPRRAWLRWPVRGLMVLAAQLSAVLLVAVLLNDAYSFYPSWREAIGLRQPQVSSPLARAGIQDGAIAARTEQAAHTGHGTIVQITIPGATSHVGDHPALVYLPPQYGDPAYRTRAFPVVELLPGYVGHPRNWTDQLGVAAVLDQAFGAGQAVPLIAVMPTTIVAPPRDTECVNVVDGPQVDTYLTTDVPTTITRAFRAQSAANGWAIMGYSTGGYCAANLALRHPDHYRAAVSLAGYAAPAHDRTTGDLFASSPTLRDQNTTTWRVQHLPPPPLDLLLIDTHDDIHSFQDDHTLANLARPPLNVAVLSLAHGGHNFAVWRAEEPTAFAWLSSRLAPPLAPIPAIDGQAPPQQRTDDHPARVVVALVGGQGRQPAAQVDDVHPGRGDRPSRDVETETAPRSRSCSPGEDAAPATRSSPAPAGPTHCGRKSSPHSTTKPATQTPTTEQT